MKAFLHLPQPLQRRGARHNRLFSEQLFTDIQCFFYLNDFISMSFSVSS
jgi:hypothetical protein